MEISSQISHNNSRRNRNWYQTLPVDFLLTDELCCWWVLKQSDSWMPNEFIYYVNEKRPLL
jgi:hypothetical protein